jgi:hypothetical protein
VLALRGRRSPGGRDTAALLDERFPPAPGTQLETASRPGEDGWDIVAATLRLGNGLGLALGLDTAGYALVSGLDGTRTLRGVLRLRRPTSPRARRRKRAPASSAGS